MSEFSKQDLGVGSLKLDEEPAALPKVCGIYLNRLKRKKKKKENRCGLEIAFYGALFGYFFTPNCC